MHYLWRLFFTHLNYTHMLSHILLICSNRILGSMGTDPKIRLLHICSKLYLEYKYICIDEMSWVARKHWIGSRMPNSHLVIKAFGGKKKTQKPCGYCGLWWIGIINYVMACDAFGVKWVRMVSGRRLSRWIYTNLMKCGKMV